MDMTNTIASLIGLYFVAAGVGLLVDRSFFAKAITELLDQPMLGYIGGILTFVVGGTIVGVHNNWSNLLSGFVSLFGWIALVEGVLILAFRRWFLGLFTRFDLSSAVITSFGAGTVVLGLILMSAAFTS